MQNQQTTNITPVRGFAQHQRTGELDVSQNSTITIPATYTTPAFYPQERYDLSPTFNTLTVSGDLLNDAEVHSA